MEVVLVFGSYFLSIVVLHTRVQDIITATSGVTLSEDLDTFNTQKMTNNTMRTMPTEFNLIQTQAIMNDVSND